MFRALLIADLHIDDKDKYRFAWLENFVTDIIRNTEEGTDLFLLGDFFEVKDRISSPALNLGLKLLRNYKSGNILWLAGQHDLYKSNVCNLHELHNEQIPSGTLYIIDSDVFEYNDLFFIPFFRNNEKYIEALNTIPDDKIVFTHIPIKQAIERCGGDGSPYVDGEVFKRFKRVYSGDIHKWFIFNNFEYIGAPSQRDFRDSGVVGNIVYFDYKTFIIRREETNHIEYKVINSISDKDKLQKNKSYILRVKDNLGSLSYPSNVIKLNRVFTLQDSCEINFSISNNLSDKVKEYVKTSCVKGNLTKSDIPLYNKQGNCLLNS